MGFPSSETLADGGVTANVTGNPTSVPGSSVRSEEPNLRYPATHAVRISPTAVPIARSRRRREGPGGPSSPSLGMYGDSG